MTLRRVVLARLGRIGRDLLRLVTLKRHETRWQTHALRLEVVTPVVAIPLKKLLERGVPGTILALIKTAVALALVAAAPAAIFAVQEIARRRSLRRAATGKVPA